MISAVDFSVLVEAIGAGLPHHEVCRALLLGGGLHAHAHALNETFSTLTGGRLGVKVPPSSAVVLLDHDLVPRVTFHSLSVEESLAAFREAESRGVRGGAIYDYLHLVSARKIGAPRLYTLNISDFQSFRRSGDPEIVLP